MLIKISLSKIMTALLVMVLCVGLTNQGAKMYYGLYRATLFTMNKPAEVMNTDLIAQKNFKAGSGIVLHTFAHVDAKGCYGAYNEWIEGPVSYQFAPLHTGRVSDKPVDREGHLFFTLPRNLPVGHYKWNLTTFPTCRGFDMAPAMIFTGAEFDVVK